jgi:hypothetical protein
MSKKKDQSNRQNATKSTGPRTERGKQNIRMNALKEGIFSKGFVITETDRPAYEALRADVLEQFKAKTAMQVLAVNCIVSSAWRHSKALHRETRLLDADALASNTAAAAPEPPSRWEWYGAHKNAALRAQELAHFAQQEIRDGGRIDSLTQEDLVGAFGPEFVATLLNWNTSEFTAMQMLKSWRKKHELYGTALPEQDTTVPKAVSDPQERLDMQQKLLQQQCDFLVDVRSILAKSEERQLTAASPEMGHRQVTATFKEFVAAVAFYDRIREFGM